MQLTGVNKISKEKQYKMVFPFDKTNYSKNEKKLFGKLINLRLSETRESLRIQKSCAQKEEGPSKIFDDPTLSTDVINDALITRLEKFEIDLRNASVRVINGSYGTFGNTIIHPWRLWLVPHATKTISFKNKF